MFFCGCSNTNNKKIESNYLQITGKAQGTTFSIFYKDSFSRDFSTAIDSILNRVDQQLSTYDTTSFISLFNNSTDTCFNTSDKSYFNLVFTSTEMAT